MRGYHHAMHRCALCYFGLLFRCEVNVASSLRRLLRSCTPNGFVCFSYRGGCGPFGVRKGVCRLKKRHRDLNPAAARALLLVVNPRMRISNSDVIFAPLFKFSGFFLRIPPCLRSVKFCTTCRKIGSLASIASFCTAMQWRYDMWS